MEIKKLISRIKSVNEIISKRALYVKLKQKGKHEVAMFLFFRNYVILSKLIKTIVWIIVWYYRIEL